MNRIYYFVLSYFIFFSFYSKAQNITISDDDAHNAHASSVLDVYSTSKGMLIPRMTDSQIQSINSPAQGLLAFNTDAGAFYFFNGTQWVNLSVQGQVWNNDNEYVFPSDLNSRIGIGTQNTPYSKLEVKADNTFGADDTLFVVKNNAGQPVFAVFQDGVRVFVSENQRGNSSGFAVGLLGSAKQDNEYFRVTPDSVRVYISENTAKASAGGFAVGLLGSAKGSGDLMRVSSDSTRVYVSENSGTKASAGGFAVGLLGSAKNPGEHIFDVSTSLTPEIINPSEARVLWYPYKEAFLTGRVLVEHADSIGTNSFAAGYEAKPIGNWSQAMGYQSVTRGDYSTALGRKSTAEGLNSFALGDSAQAYGDYSYSIGYGAQARGFGSFAVGVMEHDIGGIIGDTTLAAGDYSVALGVGAQALARTAISIGMQTESSGQSAVALGSATVASGAGSAAIGLYTEATNTGAVSLGGSNLASGQYSFAAGIYCEATGDYSAALGCISDATGHFSTAVGYNASTNGMSGSVVIGSTGTESYGNPVQATANNQFTVRAIGGHQFFTDLDQTADHGMFISPLVGNVGIGTDNPQQKLHINDVMRLEPRATPPSAASKGDIYFSSVENTLMIYTGIIGGWKKVQLQ